MEKLSKSTKTALLNEYTQAVTTLENFYNLDQKDTRKTTAKLNELRLKRDSLHARVLEIMLNG